MNLIHDNFLEYAKSQLDGTWEYEARFNETGVNNEKSIVLCSGPAEISFTKYCNGSYNIHLKDSGPRRIVDIKKDGTVWYVWKRNGVSVCNGPGVRLVEKEDQINVRHNYKDKTLVDYMRTPLLKEFKKIKRFARKFFKWINQIK